MVAFFFLNSTWPQLAIVFAGRCLYMGKISFRSTKQLPWIFTMLEQEFFMLILKWRQRYLERFEGRSTELYPLSEEGKRNRDIVAARICEARLNLELDKARLHGQTLPSHFFTCFILIHQLCCANYLLLTWISESTCEYSLCKLSRLQFVLSCDYKGRAVLALRWHVIIMASMTTMPGFLESLGTWLFSLAASHVKQISHRLCFVIESNKQDKLASKQRQEGRASQEISGLSGVSGAAPHTFCEAESLCWSVTLLSVAPCTCTITYTRRTRSMGSHFHTCTFLRSGNISC